MTKNEFLQDITEWSELLDFCKETNCPLCDDIIPEENLNPHVIKEIKIATENMTWQNLKEQLNEIDDLCDFYLHKDGFSFLEAAEIVFEERKKAVSQWGETNHLFQNPQSQGSFQVTVTVKHDK